MSSQRWAICTAPLCAAVLSACLFSGCAALSDEYYSAHPREKYLDAREPSDLRTLGIESSDLRAAVGELVAGLLASPALTAMAQTPVVVIGDCTVKHEGSAPFDTRALVDAVRAELVNAAEGRLQVLGGEAAESCCGDAAACRGDLVIRARVTEVAQTSRSLAESYTQIAFEVMQPISQTIVFADLHSFKKAGRVHSALY